MKKLIYNQLYDYFDDMQSPSQCWMHKGFRKDYSTHYCLLVILGKFK